MVSLGMTAQTSPYTGTTPQKGVFYLYNVESGLWLQNNDSRCNFWTTRADLGTRGLDFILVKDGEGYLLGGGFGKTSISATDHYLDNAAADGVVWKFLPGHESVSNGYMINNGDYYLRSVKFKAPHGADNLFTQPVDANSFRYYLELPANSKKAEASLLNTWQLVSKAERLEKMVADASYDHPQEASWLVPNADFTNNDTRVNKWAIEGFSRIGSGDYDKQRGNRVMQNSNKLSEGIPNGKGFSIELTDLPNGIYHFNVQGFYLGGFYDAVAKQMKEGTSVQRVFYFANNEKKALMSPFDEPMCQGHTTGDGNYPLTVQKTYDIGKYTFPAHNDAVLASGVVNRYCGYLNDEIEVVVTDGKLKLGIVKEGAAVANEWAVIDNFHLTYLGTDRQAINEEKTCLVVPASDVTVKLNRTLSADYWNTFCVPFSMTATQVTEAFGSDTKITKLKSVEGDVMYFEEATTIEAGMPCLIKPATTTGPEIILSGITMTDTEAQSVGNDSYKFTGTYSPVDLKTDGTNLFLQTNGNLASPADATKTMKGMRAYFEVPAGAAARIVFDDGTTTGIDLAAPAHQTVESIYTIDGRKVGDSKGIVVSKGKKYIRK